MGLQAACIHRREMRRASLHDNREKKRHTQHADKFSHDKKRKDCNGRDVLVAHFRFTRGFVEVVGEKTEPRRKKGKG